MVEASKNISEEVRETLIKSAQDALRKEIDNKIFAEILSGSEDWVYCINDYGIAWINKKTDEKIVVIEYKEEKV